MRVNKVWTTKKWKTLALPAALLVSTTGLTVATSQPAHAAVQQFTQDGITYQVDDTDTAAGATITDYDPSEGGNEVVISASITYDGVSYAVTTIGDGAFSAESLTHVDIPNSVTAIASAAFSSNPQLSEVVFEGNAPTITPVTGFGSFGTAGGKTLYFHSGASGFTTPQWQGHETQQLPYTVTLDANEGTGTMAHQTTNTTTSLTMNAFTHEGHYFVEWNTEPDSSGDTYADGAEYDFTADITLYAQWDIHTYDVMFDTGEESAVSSETVE